MKSFVTCEILGRLGNSLYSAAAALAYAFENDLRFSMPSTTPNPVWKALYLQHLVHPEFNKALIDLPVVRLPEGGFRYQPVEFKPEWAEDHIIVIEGYRQSEKYFAAHREAVLEAFGFPWEHRPNVVACHFRRGDYLKYPEKHPEVSQGWYESNMEKFPGAKFYLFSDDRQWLKDNFGDREDCIAPSDFIIDARDPRPEVQDLVLMSQCEHLIGSASTFACWAGLLNRNPAKRVILPKLWIMPGWQNTTAADWEHVVPTGPGWERA